MKRLLLAPLLLTLLFGCSGQRNSIIKDKWITGKELDSNIALNIEWKYIDCVNNICEYKERYPIIKGTPLALKTMRVVCETLEVRQIGYKNLETFEADGIIYDKYIIRFDREWDKFPLALCKQISKD